MRVIEFEKYPNNYWTVEDCRNNPTYLFVFGDNDQKFGKKGQAVIRDETNSIGIPTKKYPSYHRSSYYTDNEYETNCKKIDKAFDNLELLAINNDYNVIVFPKDGLGTGLSKLDVYAPRTLLYINKKIENFKRDFNHI